MSVVELRICGRYRLGSKIGVGNFSTIYLGKNVQSAQDVAIKIEEIKSKHSQIIYEGKILQHLQGGIGIPTFHWCGSEGDFNFLITDLLQSNLEELFKLCKRKFSLKTVLMIMDQMIANIEYIHLKNFVHRDIKPENFMIGSSRKQHQIFIIDFGLSKSYRYADTNEHLAQKQKRSLIGTARFASINNHQGIELSRRDDLESLAYMMIYFLKGSLPWSGIKGSKKEEKHQKILEKKLSISIESLCQGLPIEINKFLTNIRSLKYEDKPDYSFLRKILKERFVKEGFEFDYVYDWVLIPLSIRNPYYSQKIPMNLENEEKQANDLDSSNYSNWNMLEELDNQEEQHQQNVHSNQVQKQQLNSPSNNQKSNQNQSQNVQPTPKISKEENKPKEQKKDKDCQIF